MKRKQLILIFFVIGLFSCKKQIDDVQISIRIINANSKTTVDRNYAISETRFYLSNFQLIDASGNATNIKDVMLVKSAVNNTFSFKIPSGNFTKFRYSFGLDKTTNNSSPNSFENANPLSTQQDMYWSMLKYRFIIAEGKIDSSIAKNKTPTQLFSMHLGSDTLYRVITTEKNISKGSVINISVNMNKLFVLDADTFNLNSFSNHSDAAQIPRAITIVDSFVNGIKTDIFTPN